MKREQQAVTIDLQGAEQVIPELKEIRKKALQFIQLLSQLLTDKDTILVCQLNQKLS